MSSDPLRWGFCCAGRIASDFSLAMDNVLSNGHHKVAVAARDSSKAEEFAKSHNFGRSYGSYEELAEDSEVEIVYVSSLHPQHYELCRLFLENGKNVLCEKPLTMQLKHTEDLVALAREKKLFFMEGFWSRFFSVYESVKRHIENGDIGEVKQIHAHVHSANPIERMTKADLGGSVWFGVGVYTLNLVDFIYNSCPLEVSCHAHHFAPKVDQDVTVCLKYGGGRLALLSSSMTSVRPNNALICGTDGYIEIKSRLVCPLEYEIFKKGDTETTRHSFDLTKFREKEYFYGNCAGFCYQIEHIRKCLRYLKVTESPVMTLDSSLRMARITDTVVKQISGSFEG